MKKISKSKRAVSAEAIARLADAGKDISSYFTNKGKMMPPLQSVDVDFNQDMLDELDEAARALNVSRQAMIRLLIRQGLDQHYLAQKARKAS